jgi:VanZ family protein
MTWQGRFFVWGSVFLYCFIIFLVSAQPDLTLPQGISEIDKIAHLLEYAALGWVVAWALRCECPSLSVIALVLFSSIFTAAYGATDEWHQAYVPGRFSDVLDLVADIGGGTLGALSYVCWTIVWARWKNTLPALES